MTPPVSPAVSRTAERSDEERGDAGPNPRPVGELTDDIAGSATSLVGRRIALIVVSALGAIAVTRLLGAADFGQLAAALATWTLLTVLADFGFSLVLARDMAGQPADRAHMLRSAYRLGAQWSAVLTIVLVGVAVASGITSDRGLALLVLAPSVPAMAFVGARQVFIVLYRTRELVRMDLIIVVSQVAGQVVVAALGLGLVAVAAVISVGTIVNALVVAYVARRHVSVAGASTADRGELRRRAMPLGTMAVLSKLYLTGDLIILAWVVSDSSLGDYAAAARMLTLATSLPGLITNAALPGLASSRHDPARLLEVSTKLWHWMLVAALPVLLVIVVDPQLVVDITIGSEYTGAAELLRILAIAGFVGVASNFLGTLLIAESIVRPLLWMNVVGVVFNVSAVLLLTPGGGVVAAAWATVATEVLICVASAVVTARRRTFGPWLAVTWRPVVAVVPAVVAGLLLGAVPLLSAVVIVLVFAAATRALGAWPPEFRLPARSRIA